MFFLKLLLVERFAVKCITKLIIDFYLWGINVRFDYNAIKNKI